MKFFDINDIAKVYVVEGPTSMALGFPGLTKLLKSQQKSLIQGSLFLFVNRRKKYCKVLFHHSGGECVYMKRLFNGQFNLTGEKSFTLKALSDFLAGPKLTKLKKAA